jgi:hypothetical protein
LTVQNCNISSKGNIIIRGAGSPPPLLTFRRVSPTLPVIPGGEAGSSIIQKPGNIRGGSLPKIRFKHFLKVSPENYLRSLKDIFITNHITR